MTYLYRCNVCGHEEYHDHSMKDSPVFRCSRTVAGGARCGAKMRRVLTGGGAVIFPMSSRTRGIT